MLNMKICNFIIALLTLVIGGAIAWTSYGYGIEMTVFGPAPSFWPFILAMCLIGIAVLIIVDTWRKSEEFSALKIDFAAAQNIATYKIMLITAAFIFLIFIVGFYVAVFVYMLAAMYMLGSRSLGSMLAVTLAFLAFLYIVFSTLLHISLPLPFFME